MDVLLHLPVILRHWLAEHYEKLEIGELARNAVEMLQVEQLALATATIPIGHLAAALQRMEEVEEVRAHGGHAGTTTDVEHFGFGRLDEELTVGTADGHLIARLCIEHIAGADPGVHVHPPVLGAIPWWCGDTDVQYNDVPFGRVVGH